MQYVLGEFPPPQKKSLKVGYKFRKILVKYNYKFLKISKWKSAKYHGEIPCLAACRLVSSSAPTDSDLDALYTTSTTAHSRRGEHTHKNFQDTSKETSIVEETSPRANKKRLYCSSQVKEKKAAQGKTLCGKKETCLC